MEEDYHHYYHHYGFKYNMGYLTHFYWLRRKYSSFSKNMYLAYHSIRRKIKIFSANGDSPPFIKSI